MTTFTLVATGQTTTDTVAIEASVRSHLESLGVQLIPCSWAPDPDTIADACGVDFGVEVLDLN